MLKYGKGITLFFVFLALISLVSAVAPVTSVNLFFEEGLQVQPTLFNPIKQGEDFTFNFHVYNHSNGLMLYDVDDFSCNFHLYNSSSGLGLFGLHGLTPDAGKHVVKAFVDGDNFTENGIYHYAMHCNTSKLGGYVDVVFDVTSTGNSNDDLNIIFWVLLITSIIFGFLMYAFRPTEDSNLGLHMSLMRMILFFMCLYTLLNALGFALVISESIPMDSIYFTPLESTFEIFVWFIWIAAIITVLFFIFDLFWTFKKFGEKG